MLTLHSWPRAILHLDADAFFASVEQALHPELKGKPVITGKERGIVASLSYEAKRRGVVRGMRVFEVKKICPDVVIVPSDYETYSIFSKRMFTIMRRFTPEVEEYSIDEAFADLTGLRRLYHTSYPDIALRVKKAIEQELGISVSAGVSLSKSLAKLASKKNKPSGFLPIPGREIEQLLQSTPLEKVWGFGPNTTALLTKMGLATAQDFIQQPESFAKTYLGKIGSELWHELRGDYIYKVTSAEKSSYQTIAKMKTFTPPSSDERFIYSQLIRNLESACIKARRYNLAPEKICIYLRYQNFEGTGIEITLTRPSNHPLELSPHIHKEFTRLFNPTKQYRLTGVVLCNLAPADTVQISLFDNPVKVESTILTSEAIDALSMKYGKHTVHLASSMFADTYKRHQGDRGDVPMRQQTLLNGETRRQRLRYPMLQI